MEGFGILGVGIWDWGKDINWTGLSATWDLLCLMRV